MDSYQFPGGFPGPRRPGETPAGPEPEETPERPAFAPAVAPLLRPKGPTVGTREAAPKGPVEQNEKMNISTVYHLWHTGNRKDTVKFWHEFLNDWDIYDQRSLGLMYGKIDDTLRNLDRFNDFLLFLRMNEPSLPMDLRSAPPPHFATICSLLESLHGRVSALEKLRLA
jgi:hypothetical protein